MSGPTDRRLRVTHGGRPSPIRATWFAQLDAEMMERDNQKTLAAAGRSIGSERKAHKSYICGRQDLPL